jgi:hypothetical protein
MMAHRCSHGLLRCLDEPVFWTITAIAFAYWAVVGVHFFRIADADRLASMVAAAHKDKKSAEEVRVAIVLARYVNDAEPCDNRACAPTL